jgi:POT family proton-dependent oligopeptide transporter
MWERFSYYGMRALLVLYMVDFFKWTQADASNIYKWYTSLVYLTPLLGGFLADRYLGNKWAIIIGAILMSIGHFLMAFEAIWIFYAALGFLIMGNGFFKPNMSVQVGHLYPQNDPRRDGAYTIFYMGINLGAFLSPLVCGTLRDTPGLGYHWGFAAAGVGMVFGLLVYLIGLPYIKELPEDAVYESPEPEHGKPGEREEHVMTEKEAEKTASVVPSMASASPTVFVLLGVATMIVSPILGAFKIIPFDDVVALEIAAVCSFFAAWILSKLSMAVRDRVLAIYVLFLFVVFFWFAFEQAGNAMNVWADQTTDRYLTGKAPEPSPFPDEFVSAEELTFWPTLKVALGKMVSINPVLTTSFQSINALAIVLFAPVFAWLWVFLAKRKVNLSIAAKMSMGVFLLGVAFALMVWAAKYENQSSQTSLATMPSGFITKDDGVIHFFDAPDFDSKDDAAIDKHHTDELEKTMVAHGGRLRWDANSKTLKMSGVLNANHKDRMLRATVPVDYLREIWSLASKTQEAKKAASVTEEKKFSVTHTLSTSLPPGFDVRYFAGFDPEKFQFDEATKTFTASLLIDDKEYKQLLVAGADPVFRDVLNNLFVESAAFKVSSWWLLWFYILCTLGELCLSPVGLSMVSKLAPKKFATMLMGMWLLTSFFGNYSAGRAGELWEYFDPNTYFLFVTVVMAVAAMVCFLIAKQVTRMMHGVK